MLKNDLSLLDIPQLVMEIILEKLDFVEIVRLRKVCHSLRNYIDDYRKAEKIDEIFIRVLPDFIEMSRRVYFRDNHEYPFGKTIRIVYKNHNDGCMVEWIKYEESKEKLMKNVDYAEAFMTDFKYFLSNSKLKIERFLLNFCCSEFSNPLPVIPYEPDIESEKGCLRIFKMFFGFENKPKVTAPKPRDVQLEINILAKKVLGDIREYMKTRTTLLFIENLEINVDGEEELMEFLTYVDATCLKKLYIFSRKHFYAGLVDRFMELPNFDIKNHYLKIDKVRETERWKNLKEFTSRDYVIDLPIKEMLLFDRATVAYEKFTLEDAFTISEAIVNSSDYRPYRIYVVNQESYTETVRGLEQSIPRKKPYLWQQRIPNTNRNFYIELSSYTRTLEFFTRPI